MNRKEHLTHDGLNKIVNHRASINNGLSDKLKAAFPDTKPVPRPLVVGQEIKDPHWLAGFTSGEGCFLVNIRKSTSSKFGFNVHLRFQITQHSRDASLLKSFEKYLSCGGVYKHSENAVDFIVTKFPDHVEKIIPFFNKYPIIGVKSKDFDDWCKVAWLIKDKKHITEEGLAQILNIKAGMRIEE